VQQHVRCHVALSDDVVAKLALNRLCTAICLVLCKPKMLVNSIGRWFACGMRCITEPTQRLSHGAGICTVRHQRPHLSDQPTLALHCRVVQLNMFVAASLVVTDKWWLQTLLTMPMVPTGFLHHCITNRTLRVVPFTKRSMHR